MVCAASGQCNLHTTLLGVPPVEWIVPVILVVAIVVIAAGLYLILARKALVHLNGRVDEEWQNLCDQFSRRLELLPHLIELVKKYAPHEEAVYISVMQAREQTAGTQTPIPAARTECSMQQAVRSLFEVAEAYPKLQASTKFLQLQSELRDMQDQIQTARRGYNVRVREFNGRLEAFPNTLFLRSLHYHRREYFELDGTVLIADAPRVQF